MSFPDYEDSLARDQEAQEQDALHERSWQKVYQDLLTEAERKVNQYRGLTKRSRDNQVKLENAKSALTLLKGIEQLRLSSGNTITGTFALDEEFMTQTDDKLERKKFPKGTRVSIHLPVPGEKNYTGTVGAYSSEITLQSVVNKYGRILNTIDTKARFLAGRRTS